MHGGETVMHLFVIIRFVTYNETKTFAELGKTL